MFIDGSGLMDHAASRGYISTVAAMFCCNQGEEIELRLSKLDSSFHKLFGFYLSREMRKGEDFERVFRCFDEDGDGKISALDLRHRLGLMGGDLFMQEANAVVEALDSDGDGFLGLEDFTGLMEGAGEEEKMKDLREAFLLYDMEGCGFITPKSLKRMLSRLGESKSIDECKVMIHQFDLNGDGALSFEEFTIMMQ